MIHTIRSEEDLGQELINYLWLIRVSEIKSHNFSSIIKAVEKMNSSSKVLLLHGPQRGVILPPRVYLAMSGDIFCCLNSGQGIVTGT